MDEFEYLSQKYNVTHVFVEKLSLYNNCELEQAVIDQINFQRNFNPRRDYS